MQIEVSQTCRNFMQAIEEDLPTVKLLKYKHFLATQKDLAMPLFDNMVKYALEKNLLGEYEAIYDLIKRQYDRNPTYVKKRESMIGWIDPIKRQLEHAESISNYDDMNKCYFKLAEYYRSIGMHKQSANFYSKIFKSQNSKAFYQKSQYFSAWAQELYFDQNWNELSLFLRIQVQDHKLNDVNLAIIKDLKLIEMGQSNIKFFENLLRNDYSIGTIIANQVISFIDLGLIYSLVALAKKQRQFLKIKTVWSSKLQVLYLQNKFYELIQKLDQTYQIQGKFHPIIHKIASKLNIKIKQRILKKYLEIYSSVTFAQIEKQTSYKEGQVMIFLKKNKDLPYLIDPITQSVIYSSKSVPLYDQAVKYAAIIQDKYKESIQHCIAEKKISELGSYASRFRMGMEGRSMFEDSI